MPAAATISDWKERHEGFSVKFAHARDAGFDAIALDCLEIADNKDEEHASRRVRTEVRLKLLAKWDPRRYGERQQVDHTSSDGSMAAMDDTVAAARIAAILAAAQAKRDEEA
jgi:hypothetical protein